MSPQPAAMEAMEPRLLMSAGGPLHLIGVTLAAKPSWGPAVTRDLQAEEPGDDQAVSGTKSLATFRVSAFGLTGSLDLAEGSPEIENRLGPGSMGWFGGSYSLLAQVRWDGINDAAVSRRPADRTAAESGADTTQKGGAGERPEENDEAGEPDKDASEEEKDALAFEEIIARGKDDASERGTIRKLLGIPEDMPEGTGKEMWDAAATIESLGRDPKEEFAQHSKDMEDTAQLLATLSGRDVQEYRDTFKESTERTMARDGFAGVVDPIIGGIVREDHSMPANYRSGDTAPELLTAAANVQSSGADPEDSKTWDLMSNYMDGNISGTDFLKGTGGWTGDDSGGTGTGSSTGTGGTSRIGSKGGGSATGAGGTSSTGGGSATGAAGSSSTGGSGSSGQGTSTPPGSQSASSDSSSGSSEPDPANRGPVENTDTSEGGDTGQQGVTVTVDHNDDGSVTVFGPVDDGQGGFEPGFEIFDQITETFWEGDLDTAMYGPKPGEGTHGVSQILDADGNPTGFVKLGSDEDSSDESTSPGEESTTPGDKQEDEEEEDDQDDNEDSEENKDEEDSSGDDEDNSDEEDNQEGSESNDENNDENNENNENDGDAQEETGDESAEAEEETEGDGGMPRPDDDSVPHSEEETAEATRERGELVRSSLIQPTPDGETLQQYHDLGEVDAREFIKTGTDPAINPDPDSNSGDETEDDGDAPGTRPTPSQPVPDEQGGDDVVVTPGTADFHERVIVERTGTGGGIGPVASGAPIATSAGSTSTLSSSASTVGGPPRATSDGVVSSVASTSTVSSVTSAGSLSGPPTLGIRG